MCLGTGSMPFTTASIHWLPITTTGRKTFLPLVPVDLFFKKGFPSFALLGQAKLSYNDFQITIGLPTAPNHCKNWKSCRWEKNPFFSGIQIFFTSTNGRGHFETSAKSKLHVAGQLLCGLWIWNSGRGKPA